MFVRQLTYLVALSQHRHFAQAAESCWVSQPALSAGIRQLERELGITIIQRDRRFLGFTPEGERVLAWARQTLASLEGLRQEAALARTVPGGHLAVGAVPSALQAVTLLAGEYRRAIPELSLEVYSLSTREILQRLKRQELHLGITYLDQAPEYCEAQPLYVEHYVLVAAASAGLPARAAFSWAEAARLPLCLFNHEMQNRRIIDEAFRQAGVSPQVTVETNTISVLYSEVRSGHACSIVPLSALPDYVVGMDVTVHAIEPQRASTVALLRLQQETPSPVLAAAWALTARLDLQRELDAPLHRSSEGRSPPS